MSDSFCRTVNKPKIQVEGRGHAYIWDVEQDDPACIESERIVMTEHGGEQSLQGTVFLGDGLLVGPLLGDVDGNAHGTHDAVVQIVQGWSRR